MIKAFFKIYRYPFLAIPQPVPGLIFISHLGQVPGTKPKNIIFNKKKITLKLIPNNILAFNLILPRTRNPVKS